MKTKYMHLIDGRPANWTGEQITFVNTKYSQVLLVDDLPSIRRHQRRTKEFRLKNKPDHDPDQYGYMRVKVTALKGRGHE